MPTSFTAFSYRDGYPRRIPDDGKFYHLGKKVNSLITSGLPNQHPEIDKPAPKKRRTKGEKSDIAEMRRLALKGELSDTYGNPVAASEVPGKVDGGFGLKKATPVRPPSGVE